MIWILILGMWGELWAAYSPSTIPNPKQFGQNVYVANPDSIISTNDEIYINHLASMLEDSTDVELCVVALNSIGEYEAFDFSYELFQRWGLGKKDKSTGVLLLMALESRDVRITTGAGIEGVLTDAVCARIIRDDMVPIMKKGDYSGGLCYGALRIYTTCTNEDAPNELMNAQAIVNREEFTTHTEEPFPSIWVILMVALILGIAFACIYAAAYSRCPHCGKRKMRKVKEQVLQHATLEATGVGVATYMCSHCGHTHTKTYTIARETPVIISTNSGSSSFGGSSHIGSWGGGGTFGGGAGGKF